MTNLVKLYLKEILENDMNIAEVPSKLKDGVQEQLDKLNQLEESGE